MKSAAQGAAVCQGKEALSGSYRTTTHLCRTKMLSRSVKTEHMAVGGLFYPKYLSVWSFLATVGIKSANPASICDMLVCSELQYHRINLRGGSHRSAGDFSVVEDETQLSGITQTLCLKPKTHVPFLRNLHLPACLQSYHWQTSTAGHDWKDTVMCVKIKKRVCEVFNDPFNAFSLL